MIVHSADGVACLCRLFIGRRIGDDSGTALFPPLAALPIDLVLVHSVAQITILATEQHTAASGCLHEFDVFHTLCLPHALHHLKGHCTKRERARSVKDLRTRHIYRITYKEFIQEFTSSKAYRVHIYD